MGKKYLGEDHYFTQRFVRRMAKPLGNGMRGPSPQRSIKHDSSKVVGPRAISAYGPIIDQNESDIIVDVVTNK